MAIIDGTSVDEILNGTSGVDTINAGGGSDTLDGGTGSDFLDGGTGDDVFIVYSGDGLDTINGSFGTDTIKCLDLFIEMDFISGIEYIIGASDLPSIIKFSDKDNIFNFASTRLENISYLIGGAGNDWIFGTYIGSPSVDDNNSILGGLGNDTLEGGIGDDYLVGGGGIDMLSYGHSGFGVAVDLRITTPQNTGSAGFDQVEGFEGIIGTGGADTLTGSFGDDTISAWDHNDIVNGEQGDDSLAGEGYNDTLSGGWDNDTLAGGSGNDLLDGGYGEDVAAFGSPRANYSVRAYVAGGDIHYEVIDRVGTAGADTLSGIEILDFAGEVFRYLGPWNNHQSGLDGDRFDDVLLFNSTTRSAAYIDMAANGPAGVKPLLGPLPAGWRPTATGDLTGDGRAEVFLQDSATGSVYFVNTALGSSPGVIRNNLSADWVMVGVGDFTSDGVPDIVLRSQTSGMMLYGDLDAGGAFNSWGIIANPGTGWLPVGVGAITGAGTDVVIQNIADGTTLYARVIGGTFAEWRTITGPNGGRWGAREVVDLSGDGYADVLFQNGLTGELWYASNNLTNTTWHIVATAPGWDVAGSGDYDNDGDMDFAIRDPASGAVYYGSMENGAFQGWVIAGSPGAGWITP